VLNYTEDSGLMSLIPEDVQDEFSFANRGVDTGYSVRLSIVRDSNDDPGRLVITESVETLPDSIGVSGNNTSTIFVQSTAAFENAPVADFTNVFSTVQISFADQAPMRYIHVYIVAYYNKMFVDLLGVQESLHMMVVQ